MHRIRCILLRIYCSRSSCSDKNLFLFHKHNSQTDFFVFAGVIYHAAVFFNCPAYIADAEAVVAGVGF